MALTCVKCSRLNPDEAFYCYFDGVVLNGHGGQKAGPVATGSQPFLSPFVFPNGRTCRSFDELALACQQDWASARAMLQEGHLGAFFGGLGRADLALAARQAVRFPDPDRGLDQLLAKLPTAVLDEPKLRCTPKELNLGLLDNSKDQSFDLHLENQGMRLLYGTVTIPDCPWLTLGAPPGVAEKMFDFGHEMVMPVHVKKEKLRASSKPFSGKLIVDCNGGTVVVTVKAELPVKPFPDGVLAGAVSPRQVAEKAKASPREAAALFENGAVENWYRSNGWTYPVQTPAASGMAAVQQFFEALGLTKPPKVAVNVNEVNLDGRIGEALRFEIQVSTEEKRPVYASAFSNQSWLEVGRARLSGRTATIGIAIPSVPDRSGETITAKLTVLGNGNQKFVIPVNLNVAFDPNAPPPLLEEAPPLVEEVPMLAAEVPALVAETAPAPAAVVAPAPPPAPQPASLDFSSEPESLDIEPPRPTRRSRASENRPWLHLIPAVVLGVALVLVLLFEWLLGGGSYDPRQDNTPRLKADFDDEWMRFSLSLPQEKDPTDPTRNKLLIFEDPRTGRAVGTNTVVRIDDDDTGGGYFFGNRTPLNVWVNRREDLPSGRGAASTMEFKQEKIVVKQHVEIVRGPSELLDTCLIWYNIKNNDPKNSHKVGVRLLIDTYIGGQDGVAFTIPGQAGFFSDFKGGFDRGVKDLPNYVEAIEKPDDPSDPGTVARLTLRGVSTPGGMAEEVERLLICRFPGSFREKWEWDYRAKGRDGDSCVVVYWGYQSMKPGDERNLAIQYGLSELSVGEGGEGSRLGFSDPGFVPPNSTFDLVCYVYDAKAGQSVVVTLPNGLTLAPGEKPEKTVDGAGKRSKVSWKVKTSGEGVYEVKAGSGAAHAKPLKVKVQSRSIFTGG